MTRFLQAPGLSFRIRQEELRPAAVVPSRCRAQVKQTGRIRNGTRTRQRCRIPETNSKQQGGAVGSLTGGVITRQSLYEHAMALALVTFRHEEFICGWRLANAGNPVGYR